MNRDFIKAVNERLLYETAPRKSDVAIVLGNNKFCGDLARVAARHYFEGHFEHIILCGGVKAYSPSLFKRKIKTAFRHAVGLSTPPFTVPTQDIFVGNRTESEHMHHVLKSLGVPERAIAYIDRRSTNTGENFEFICGHVRDAGYQTASIIAGAYHQRRAVETCARWMPELSTSPIAVYPHSLTREEFLDLWPRDDLFRALTLSEYRKLDITNPDNYYKQGFCVPVDNRQKPQAPILAAQ